MRAGNPGETLPTDRSASRQGREGQERGPALVVAFRCDAPFELPSRHSLVGVDAVVIGRGPTRASERIVEEGENRLVLRVPDPRMSSTHVRVDVVRTSGPAFFMARDAKSRNGTLVNGAQIESAPLADGDVIEAGQTLFLYREGVATGGERDATPAGLEHVGLVSLVPELVADFATIEKLAPTAVTLLICAETGAGKEVLARAIHTLSQRTGPYVPVNCGALPATLVESELFGHKKGAFSGAAEDRTGLVRSAHGGTLFLDEIGDLPVPSQTALLRVLQEREVTPLGATRPTPVDVRVIAATHRDLDEMASTGSFRGDLLARISGYSLTVPPLRERREDLALLVASLLSRIAGERARGVHFTPAAARALLRYEWPHNVRELEKCIEAAYALAQGTEGTASTVGEQHLPPKVRAAAEPPAAPLEHALSDEDRRHRDELVALLREHDFNISAVARATGKARMQIQRWMRRYRIRAPR